MNNEQVLHTYSPLALAYLGDGVYELFVRTYILEQGNCQNQKLHQKAQKYVNCAAQERFLNHLLPELTETEQEAAEALSRNSVPDIFRRLSSKVQSVKKTVRWIAFMFQSNFSLIALNTFSPTVGKPWVAL